MNIVFWYYYNIELDLEVEFLFIDWLELLLYLVS